MLLGRKRVLARNLRWIGIDYRKVYFFLLILKQQHIYIWSDKSHFKFLSYWIPLPSLKVCVHIQALLFTFRCSEYVTILVTSHIAWKWTHYFYCCPNSDFILSFLSTAISDIFLRNPTDLSCLIIFN